MKKTIFEIVFRSLDPLFAKIGIDKTDAIGALMVLLALLVYFNVLPADVADSIREMISPAQLGFGGVALLTGRDAVRKLSYSKKAA